MEGVGACNSALFCSQPEGCQANKQGRHRAPAFRSIASEWTRQPSQRCRLCFLSRKNSSYTLGGSYEEFRYQNKALLLGKLCTAVFCQWPSL